MTPTVQALLHSFELLSDAGKCELVAALLQRSAELDLAQLCDEDLVHATDILFAELDRRESENERVMGSRT